MKFKIILLFFIIYDLNKIYGKINGKNAVIDNISDIKDFKKILRTKTNVLVLFLSNIKENQNIIKLFGDASDAIKGIGTMLQIDCSTADSKKLCKKLKVAPSPVVLKHYKDGDFNKDYDRPMQATSIVNFMRDPTGDVPWEEDPIGVDVVHIPDAVTLGKFIKKETRPILVMFYAPWCGFCKTLKPEFSAAATELKPKYILSAIDVNRPENSIIRKQYNITGFPTLLYFEGGMMKQTFEGENNKAGIISFMHNPTAPPASKPKEADWAESNSDIVHLTATNFEPVTKEENSVLIMFYAPWCGHCKRMKPEYEKAAEIMKNKKIPGVLAALDATKEPDIAAKYGVKGYPTVKYFVKGEVRFDVNVRDSDKIVSFMTNPQEPPPPPPPDTPWDEEKSEVIHLTDDSFKSFLKKKKHVIVMFYAPWCGHCKNTKPEFLKAANHFRDDSRIELAAVDCTKHQAICKSYEVGGYPTIKYFNYLKNVKQYEGGRTSSDFIKYLTTQNGEDKNQQASSIKSPPPSATGNQEPPTASPKKEFEKGIPSEIITLTDKTFDTEVKKYKRVLVMFHAAWCNICKEVKPELEKTSIKLKQENDSYKIAFVDCGENFDVCEKFYIQAFPTIKYFEKGVFVKDFIGKRTTEVFYKYVMEEGNKKLEL